MTPRTIASSVLFDGSCSSVSTGFSPSPKNACPDASPNPLGITMATAVLPFLTASRASSTVGLRELQVLVALGARDDGLRDVAAVLIHDRHRDPCRLAVLSAAREHRSEKRRDRDRDDEAHDDRSTVAEKQLQVLADHGEEGNDSHQSRKLLPVSVRNTDSSVALPPPTTATRDCRPSSVSSAITLPWSMTTMRSASRSTSSM